MNGLVGMAEPIRRAPEPVPGGEEGRPTVHAPRAGSRRPRRVVAGLALLLLVAGLGVANTRSEPSPTERALEVLDDESSFTTVVDTGAAFVRASTVLQAGAEECAANDRGRGRQCDELFAASAHTRVSGVAVLSCTKRGAIDARERLRGYLRALSEEGTAALPALPSCRT